MTSTIEDAVIKNSTIDASCLIGNSHYYGISNTMDNVITSTSMYDYAKDIVKKGLEDLSLQEFCEIACQKFLRETNNIEDYETLLRLNNNDYLQTLKIILTK